MKITLDTATCQGTGMCEALAPDFFRLDDHGELTVLAEDVPEAASSEVREAVESCPTGALNLLDGPAA